MSKRRVVITGLGMVTPVGLNVEDSWQAILHGNSGVSRIERFDVSNFTAKISASIKNFDPSIYLNTKDVRKNDVFVQFGIAASAQAIADANLEVDAATADRVGVAIGSGIGGLPEIERTHQVFVDSGPRKISPFFIPSAIINMISGQVSIRYGFTGPNFAIVTACTTGSHNIGMAARTIAYNDADVMIAGGAEMATSELGIGGFAALRALSTRNDEPEQASRPWDKDRDGFVLGEGAGVVVLEEYEHAKQRGAKIYAELVGFGMSADAHHITLLEPNGRGGTAAMKHALDDAKLNPEDIQYINAHATSTPAGDEVELLAIRNAFGAHAYNLSISSTKSMIGHLLGAAGAVEAIFTILAIRDQVAPPTINLDNPSDGCKDFDLVAHTAKPLPINAAVSNSFGFGGTNGALVFKQI